MFFDFSLKTLPETSKNYTRLFETTSWSTRYTAEPRREATNTALRNESFPVGPPLGDSDRQAEMGSWRQTEVSAHAFHPLAQACPVVAGKGTPPPHNSTGLPGRARPVSRSCCLALPLLPQQHQQQIHQQPLHQRGAWPRNRLRTGVLGIWSARYHRQLHTSTRCLFSQGK